MQTGYTRLHQLTSEEKNLEDEHKTSPGIVQWFFYAR